VLTRTATELVTKRATFRYSDGSSQQSLGFPVPFPEYVFHVEEAEVQERLNRSLPVSLWINIFQLPLKIWSWSVSLVRNKPRIFIYSPIYSSDQCLYVSHLIFFWDQEIVNFNRDSQIKE
jgi:hypothetical protein